MSKAREISELGDVVAVDGSNVGIGTSSPNEKLTVNGGFVVSGDASASSGSGVTLGFDTANLIGNIYSLSPGVAWHDLAIRANQTVFFGGGSERMRIDNTGRVGIGTSSPKTELSIGANNTGQGPKLTLENTDTSLTTNDLIGQIDFYANDGSTNGTGPKVNISAIATSSAGTLTALTFGTSDSASATAVERMRIDASGNLLVGTTNTALHTSTTESGVRAGGAGPIMSAGAGTVGYFNRNGGAGDGTIIDFRKDGTTVGSIGVNNGTNFYQASSYGAGLKMGSANVVPSNASGASNDNAIDLGSSLTRFDDIYATNGTIQTSDANEKQQIAELTDAEMQAAKAISKLFKTFKWNNSVAEKGDDARIHTGVIAQEVEAAMTAAGLDAGDYAFFISSTWWESTEVIPAVEAVAAVEATYDEEGNILTEAVEAVEAQPERTVTHTHGTAEEAPAGAVERTRKGIRYPQLLAFIGAATEQRLASIEARLDALETV